MAKLQRFHHELRIFPSQFQEIIAKSCISVATVSFFLPKKIKNKATYSENSALKMEGMAMFDKNVASKNKNTPMFRENIERKTKNKSAETKEFAK